MHVEFQVKKKIKFCQLLLLLLLHVLLLLLLLSVIIIIIIIWSELPELLFKPI